MRTFLNPHFKNREQQNRNPMPLDFHGIMATRNHEVGIAMISIYTQG